MAEKILIMGESGTGKSTSIRNCDPSITAIVNPVGKPLPFRGAKKFNTLNGETDADRICEYMRSQVKSGKKIIIVDDFQYILAIPYMNRIKEIGWDKYNDFGSNYFNIIDVCNELPDDICVYYLTHCETLDNGLTTVKLIGKLLREKITVEGLFTIVLKTGVSEGKYYFFTQNSGKDTVKSPIGMFDSFSVDNDLAYIDAKIRNYYEFEGAMSDEQVKTMDEEKSGDVEKPEPRRRRGSASRSGEIPEDNERRSSHGHSRSEKTREEVMESNQKKLDDYVNNIADQMTGLPEELPFQEYTDKVDVPEHEPMEDLPRRKLSEVTTVDDVQSDINKAIEEAGDSTEAAPKKRVRKNRSK